MNVEVKSATIFPNQIHSGITLTQINTNPIGTSFAVSKVGKKYSVESIQIAQQNFSTTLGIQRNRLQFLEQIHSDTIHIVNEWTPNLSGDAVITSSKNLVLCISVADCVGITLYDTENQLIAGIHSGWRGTVKNIVGKTIQTMKNEFNTKPSKLLAFISPSASKEKYIVQNDVSSLFDSKYVCTIDSNIHLDVQKNVFDQLVETGVQLHNIECDNSCTISNNQFHSFRRDGEMFGLNVVYIHQIFSKIKRISL
jgi:hypothetical protein